MAAYFQLLVIEKPERTGKQIQYYGREVGYNEERFTNSVKSR